MKTSAVARMLGIRLWSGIVASLLMLMVASAGWAVPMVTNIQPPDGGLAPIDTTVTAAFSEAMDSATVTAGSFALSRFVGFKAIVAGNYHTVALKNDGTVVAWGGNSRDQTTIPAGLSGVTAIAAGPEHTVALKSDGTVVAWGYNSYGQALVPAGLSDVISIAAGAANTVALKRNGTVVAWGSNTYGQNTFATTLSGVVAIAAGSNHILALMDDGTVVAWGYNGSGQTTVPSGLSGVKAIVAGWWHSVALKDDGTVVAWGRNDWGQATVPTNLSGVVAIGAGGLFTTAIKGNGMVEAWGRNESGQTAVPTGISGVTAIATGAAHVVALKSDGTAAGWGNNSDGQARVPVGFSGVMAVSVADWHMLALKNCGTVEAWGYNNGGQTTVPAGLTGVTAIAAGSFHSVALKNDGTVVAWGGNGSGQTSIPTGLSEVTAIAAEYNQSFAVKRDGTVVAWGNNDWGQTTVPAGLSGVTTIAAGETFTLALKDDGTVVAWGRNESGQTAVPADLSGITAIAAGSRHSMALKSDGTVVVWGSGYYAPAGLSGVVAIAAGKYDSVALKNDGTVVAWGRNYSGQFTVPADLSGVVAIDAGFTSAAAVKSDGTVVAWGQFPYFFSPLGPYETSVEGTVAYDEGVWTATFTPLAPLEPDMTYFATVNTGVRNATGVPLAADGRWSFTVPFYINHAPTADAGPDRAGTVGQGLTVSGAGSSDSDGNIVGYVWNWGDGTPDGSGLTATHVYSSSGTKTVTLTVTDNAGATAIDTMDFQIETLTVTLTSGPNGSIAPLTTQHVNYNQTTAFAVTPGIGYHILSVTGCGGSLNGNIYTTGPITADCTVTADFQIDTFTVTPSAGLNGSIAPSTPQTLNYDQTTAFAVTPEIGYHILSVAGCGGSLNGNTYTTGPVTAACSVAADFQKDPDTTAPTISGYRTPEANADGWNNTDITVYFTASDADSGIAAVTGTTVVSTEGAGQQVVGIAVDKAGNSATYIVSGINIDKTAPMLDAGPDVTVIEMTPVVLPTPAANDNLDPNPVVTSNVPASFLVGATMVTVTATDRAGNAASDSLVVTVMTTQDYLQLPIATINGLPPTSFENNAEQRKNALSNKIDAVMSIVAAAQSTADPAMRNALITDAISRMESVQAKMDGCRSGGTPDANDWIIDCAAQSDLNRLIDMILAALNNLRNV